LELNEEPARPYVLAELHGLLDGRFAPNEDENDVRAGEFEPAKELRAETPVEFMRLFCVRLGALQRLAPEFENERDVKDGEKLPRDGMLARLRVPENPPRGLLKLWRDEPMLMWEPELPR
jgi:hypothetical protein